MATAGGPPSGSPQAFTEADAAALADKIAAWSETLPANERALLSIVMSRARATETPDTTGYQGGEMLQSAQTRPWLTNIAVNSTWETIRDSASVFSRDVGPAWVNSPRASTIQDRVNPQIR
jgi:hypothetical protein